MKMRNLLLIPLLLLLVPLTAGAQGAQPLKIQSQDIDITSNGQAYHSYLAAPAEGGPYPGIVLIHSFNGLEPGYRTMVDELAAKGFVALAIGWQTFEKSPNDKTVNQLVLDSVDVLKARKDVDPQRLGLTGFCAGGRYTMLFLPTIPAFKAGVAWYGFPYNGDTKPADLVTGLTAPMLIIHGTADQASKIGDIYRYATALADAKKSFELKVYGGEPHGFMLVKGNLRQDEIAQDAFNQMVTFFQRKLG